MHLKRSILQIGHIEAIAGVLGKSSLTSRYDLIRLVYDGWKCYPFQKLRPKSIVQSALTETNYKLMRPNGERSPEGSNTSADMLSRQFSITK